MRPCQREPDTSSVTHTVYDPASKVSDTAEKVSHAVEQDNLKSDTGLTRQCHDLTLWAPKRG